MKALFALGTLPLILALSPAQKPTQDVGGAGCGTPTPTTVQEWRKVSAIVRVRIDSQAAYQSRPLPSWIMTKHEATVLDVIKADSRVPGVGASLTIHQNGGTVEHIDKFVSFTQNQFPPMPVGSEWLLFLTWVDQLQFFMIYRHEDGAFQIRGGRLTPPGSSRWAERWRDQRPDTLTTALRGRR
jgi:hypothetical protein